MVTLGIGDTWVDGGHDGSGVCLVGMAMLTGMGDSVEMTVREKRGAMPPSARLHFL